MKKLLPAIFAFLITASYARMALMYTFPVPVKQAVALPGQNGCPGTMLFSGQFNGKDLHIRNFEYQGSTYPMSIRFDNTMWVLQSDETSEVIFQNTAGSGYISATPGLGAGC